MIEVNEVATSSGTTCNERGASLVEYALLVALIAIACFVAVTFFGDQTGDTFSRVSSSVSAV